MTWKSIGMTDRYSIVEMRIEALGAWGNVKFHYLETFHRFGLFSHRSEFKLYLEQTASSLLVGMIILFVANFFRTIFISEICRYVPKFNKIYLGYTHFIILDLDLIQLRAFLVLLNNH